MKRAGRWIVSALVAAPLSASMLLGGCLRDACRDGDFECIDEDGDGCCAICCDMPDFPASSCELLDCDDGDAAIHPRAADWYTDGGDFDCDGTDLGGEGALCQDDSHCVDGCNLTVGTCVPEAEQCGSGIDEDGDGDLDCADDDCTEVCPGLLAAACEAAPLVAASGEGPSGSVSDDFLGAGNLGSLACGGHDTRERHHRLPPMAGPGVLSVSTSTPSLLGIGTSCGAAERACAAGGPEPTHVVVEAGDELWVTVEQISEAPFELAWSLERAVCGDGIIVPPETCDDGNATGADGCDVACRVETAFDPCSTAGSLETGVTHGHTAMGTNLLAASCGGVDGLERLHVFTPPADGTLQIGITSEAPLAVYALGGCGSADELACVATDQAAGVAYVPVTAGVAVVVVVDGLTPFEGAAYSLTTLFSPG